MKSIIKKSYNLGLTLTALTVLGLATSQSANAVGLYSITDLGTLGAYYTHCPECEEPTKPAYIDTSVAFGINNAGQIAGRSITPGGYKQAFLWENGMIKDLSSVEGNSNSFAYDINDLSQIIGSVLVDGTDYYHAYLQENGVMQTLSSFGSNLSSEASSINNAGQIVGNAAIPDSLGSRHAVLWEDGMIKDIGTFGGKNSWAYHINDAGQVVGSSDLDSPYRAHHAFVWENGVMKDLGTLGGHFSKATSINNVGQVVGYASSVGIYEGIRAFLWENGVMKDLGTLSNDSNSYAQSINNSGQVVGSADIFNGNFVSSYAFLWQNGGMTNLNQLIPLDSGWSLEVAMDINDSGQIVGWGKINNQTRAFLLTPVPEPASAWSMLAFGVLGIASMLKPHKH